MRKRILFVDDELLVLEGLARMLRPKRNDWEMVFVDNGARALQLMAEAPFDVVISDMRMPGMNGAELLAQVLKRWPQTIRLVLSGHADQDLVLKCVGSTHQFLSKPCKPEELKAAIVRASELERSLHDRTLRELVSKMDRLPSMPALYVELIEMLRNPQIGLDEVGAVVAKDMAMTAKILKLVNSAYFGLGRQISSAVEAVSYLGLETIKSLVLCVHAFSQFSTAPAGTSFMDELWAHSQTTAGLAKEIARRENTGAKIEEEAFVAGLLHDTGKLVLASNFPAGYKQVLSAGGMGSPAVLSAEEDTFGANHAEVGAYLFGLWGLPTPVIEAVALHHHPRKSTHLAFSPLTAVHSANALANARSNAETDDAEFWDLEYLRELGLHERLGGWRALARGASPVEPLHA